MAGEPLRSVYQRVFVPFLNPALKAVYRRWLAPVVNWMFFYHLIEHTQNFSRVKWLGTRCWQNVLDLWVIQETLAEVKPELLVECGTNQGGSALFYAHIFDLLGYGRIVTIDIEKLHHLSHPRITFIEGSSTSPEVVDQVRRTVETVRGPVMVILDSDHSMTHVLKELECYAPFVTKGSYCLVQDGAIDKQWIFQIGRPGPLPAIERFLRCAPQYRIDAERCSRFVITHHPKGWLLRHA